ncbi:hypothetical protein DV737_g4578, partial [Chaetothyriales sp. CBS 132003]
MSANSDMGKSGAYEAGKENSHQPDDSSEPNDDSSRKVLSEEDRAAQKDPTLPARLHGNEPSRGAEIDKEIADEEAEIIAKMDAKRDAKK